MLAEFALRQQAGVNPEPFLLRKSGQSFYNTSPLDMRKLMGDQDHIRENLYSYVQGFAPAVRDVFERFEFHTQIERLARAGLLYQVTEKFAQVDLHPETVDNHQMGLVFEELIRKFAEISNETAGEHFTPREVIRLMVNLIFIEDDDVLAKPDKRQPMAEAGSGEVQQKERALLNEIIAKVNTLFEGELSDDDKLVYVNHWLKGKLLESQVLAQQAASNTKEQFANSPDLASELMSAIIDAFEAHSTMSRQALDSEKVRNGLREILLGPAGLYEALRQTPVRNNP